MATHDLDSLLDGAAPAPAGPLDVPAVEARARRRRRRRRAATGATTLLAAVAVAAVAGLARDDRPRTVLAGPPASAEIPLNYSKQDSITLGLLDGTTVLVNLPGPLSAAFAHVRYADLELHGSIYAELDQLHTGARAQAGPPRGWTIDVGAGDVGTVVGGERLTLPGSAGASAAFIDRAGRRLGLQFGPWAAVLRGESMTDADIGTLLARIDVATDAGGFPRYRGSLPLWLADAPNLSVPGRDMSMSVFIRDCTVPAVTVQVVDWGTVVCDPTRKVEVLLRSDAPLPVEFANSMNLFVSVRAVGSSLSGLRDGLHP